jgi:methylmalonyl-CoA/ethylmalonyl-CoA epimerase
MDTLRQQNEQPKIDLGPVVQVGIVVRDVDVTVRGWGERFSFAQAVFTEWPPENSNLAETATYRGGKGNFRMRLAFIETGAVQIEFIQPLEGGNIYSEFLEQHGEGLHHILFLVEDPEGVSRWLEAPILQSGGSFLNPGAIWAYLDTQQELGCIIEVKTKL